MGQHFGMGDRSLDVVCVESVIELDAGGELLDSSVGRRLKYSRTRWSSQECSPQGHLRHSPCVPSLCGGGRRGLASKAQHTGELLIC